MSAEENTLPARKAWTPDRDTAFVTGAISKIFEWLNWIAIMAAIAYWAQKSHSLEANVAFACCYALFGLYFFALIVRWIIPSTAGASQTSKRFWMALVAMSLAALAAYEVGHLSLIIIDGLASGAS